jgi:hypothetical protein
MFRESLNGFLDEGWEVARPVEQHAIAERLL